MSETLNPVAVENAAILRALAEPARQIDTVVKLAELVGRDESNLRKTLKRLASEGLLTDKPLIDGLTEAGRAQLAMIGRAEHGGDPAQAASDRVASDSDKNGRVRGFWPIDKIRPNPANRPIDATTIPGLADSIEAAGEVLQPALLTPPDASGVRMLLAGERRWSALRLLQERGTADEDLWGRGLPFIEKEADRPTALLITLIENGQRQDLSPWEDAQQLHALQRATGWSAREIAKKTGRSPEGSETGVRDVQIKIKVAEEATPEARAQYEQDVRDGRADAWQRLKASLQPPKPPAPANPRMALMIAEAAQVSERLHGVWDGAVPLSPGLAWIASDNQWWTYDAAGTFILKTAACDWLASADFEEDADRVLMRLQSEAGAPHVLPGVHTADPSPSMGEGGSAQRDAQQPAPGAEGEGEAAADRPLTAAHFGVPADWKTHHLGSVPAMRGAAAEWIEPGSLETFALPVKKGEDYGYPRAQMQIARIKGSQGWIEDSGYSVGNLGHHEMLAGVLHADQAAFASRHDALTAAAERIRRSLGTSRKGGVPADIETFMQGVLTGAIQPLGAADAPAPATPAAEAAPARPSSGGSRGSAPVPGSEAAARALAELARWERVAPANLRAEGAVRIDRTTAWTNPAFRQLREAALIRVLDVAGGSDGTATYAAVRPSGREWLATKGTGYVAAVHNTTVWLTPWIARVATALKQPTTASEAVAHKNVEGEPADAFTPTEDQTVRLVTMIEALCDALDETVNFVADAYDPPAGGDEAAQADELQARQRALLTTIEDRLAAEDLPDQCCRAQEGQGVIDPEAVTGEGPAVPVRRSIRVDSITCLEDGRRFVGGLKRHLRTRHNLSPEEYREKWGLPADYPMVAPNFAKAIDDRRRALGIEQ